MNGWMNEWKVNRSYEEKWGSEDLRKVENDNESYRSNMKFEEELKMMMNVMKSRGVEGSILKKVNWKSKLTEVRMMKTWWRNVIEIQEKFDGKSCEKKMGKLENGDVVDKENFFMLTT